MADSKKLSFSKSPILKKIWRKFYRLVLGLVGLIDAKGIDLAQPIWPWGCPTYGLKQGKNGFLEFFSHFWAYVGQPHDRTGWAKSMPFASINPTNPRTNPWKFHEKILRIGGAGKWVFFEAAILNFLSRPFWFFFFKKKNFFCFILIQIIHNLWGTKDFSKFWWLLWFPEKS